MKLKEKEIIKQNQVRQKIRSEMYNELIPIAKSFALWLALVTIVSFDYNVWHLFANYFISITAGILVGLGKILPVGIKIIDTGYIAIASGKVFGVHVLIAKFMMLVELECTGYYAFLSIFCLLLFASWNIKEKLIRGAIMFLVLLVVNNIRIILLGWVGHRFLNAFNSIHDYVWNILLVAICLAMWLYFDKSTVKAQTIKA